MDNKLHESLEEKILDNLKKIDKKGDISDDDLCKVKHAYEALYYMEGYKTNEIQNTLGYSEGTHMHTPMSYGPNRSPVTGRYISGTSYGHPMGYSGHSIKDRMVAKLEGLYDEATTEYDRQKITNTINRIHSEN